MQDFICIGAFSQPGISTFITVCVYLEFPASKFEVFAVEVQPVLVDLLHSWIGPVHQLEACHVRPELLELGHVQVHEALTHKQIFSLSELLQQTMMVHVPSRK